ncbi:M42 family metallopeptidase [Persicirhabdus sediminis]|uniref:M20/M25/M40 family metallo-hydrolase n=1 Tax=Persicirhabdus sediminis TaxID=454144 RepID=A0A8J7MGX6_9BACT|nr:M20/M25/M40 family metallo-hydrolase [Persicirhabdus sediminis]MBK1792740.1 M20/M25/M40 family metallo-hydrolase [Persicirhabdus sediminis]
MSIDVPFLAKVCEVPGAPGFEKAIRELVIDQLDGLCDEFSVDHMGNVVALKKGRSEEMVSMAAAHMDEIGFIVTHIDDNGFVRFNPLGGFDPKTLTAQRVIVHGKKDLIGVMGCKPIHIMEPEERGKNLKLKDYFIDLGMDKEQVAEFVEVGNPITRRSELLEIGDCVNVKSLDNRVSVFLLLEVLRKMKEEKLTPAYDFYASFTVQEEVGLRGAQVSALAIQPDFSFGLDTTIAYDTPGSQPQERCTSMGKGAAIKIMDSSTICDYRMVAYMKEVAGKHEIDWQPEILAAGGTDTASLQRMVPGGSIAGAVSIPTRHIHQSIEMASKTDIAAGIDLLTACLCELDGYDWSF